jgi:thiosulfate/3-mercaptopyruvate sulfurtransferase
MFLERLVAVAVTLLPMASAGGTLQPLVSTGWLSGHLNDANLKVVDVRSAAEYAAGHIPQSISLPFEPVSVWSAMGPGDLLLEMPPPADIMTALGAAGLSNPSPATKVVLVYGVGVPSFPQAAAPRVATTLKYVGISTGRVAVLDGGFNVWQTEGRNVTTAVPTVSPATYTASADTSFLVDIDYVHARINRVAEHILLLDGRDASVYNGSVVEQWALAPGHIPSARSLPAVGIWNADGSYKTTGQLMAKVQSVIAGDVGKNWGEIIVYCGVGGYASSWYFVLTRVLGFTNVKMYDGSAQEWSQHYPMEL